MLCQGDNGTHKLVRRSGLPAGQARARKVEKIREQLVEPLRFFCEDVEAFGAGVNRGLTTGQDAGSAADAGERVANLVSEACGKLARDGETLSLFQLLDVLP